MAQTTWDDKVKVAMVAAAEIDVDYESDPTLTSDLRPRLFDYNSGRWLLVDSGAAVSVYPRSAFPNAPKDPDKVLQAVNGAKIATYGQRAVKVNLGSKTYTHNFTLADIDDVILGWSFILDYKLDLVWQGNKCTMTDKKARKTFKVHLSKAKKQNLNLALVSYKQYADAQKGKEPEVTIPIPQEYQELIDQHKAILEVNFTTVPSIILCIISILAPIGHARQK